MPFAAADRHHYWSVDIRHLEDHGLERSKPVSVISMLENCSRAILASGRSPRQDLTAYLIVLRAAIETHGAPEGLVSDSGSVCKANHAQAIDRTLGIAKHQSDRGQAGQHDSEPHFNVMRRMADDHFTKATAWDELQAVPDRFFIDDNQQAHFAHRARTDGRHSPAAVLGWVHGAWCDPADLDRLFRLRATRVFTAGGSVRFRHWRLSGERGLAGEHDVTEPRLFVNGHPSPQPFLAPLEDVVWRPAQRLAPDRVRRRRGEDRPERLVADKGDQAVG